MPMHKKSLIVVVAAALCCSCSCGSTGVGPWYPITAGAPAEQQIYDERFAEAGTRALEHLGEARLEIGAPAMSAAVAVGGDLVWAGVVGYADMGDELPATIGTKFRIGSTSKAVTATGLARLVDAGIIDIDEPISTYLPDPPNEKWAHFTCRQLASHTAGLPGYEENTDLAGGIRTIRLNRQYDDVIDALDVFDGSKLLFEPGEGFHYSSFDVNLMSVVMQAAGGEPYLDLMRDRVFDPLGMESTHADYQDRAVGNRATFYEMRRNEHAGREVQRWKDVNLSLKWASGGLVSTSSNLVRLGSSYFDAEFIDPKTVEAFWTPQELNNGEVNEQSYAIGWRSSPEDHTFGEDRPTRAVHHGGVSKGSMSWLVIYPEFELVMAININTRADAFHDFAGKGTEIAREFLKAVESPGKAP